MLRKQFLPSQFLSLHIIIQVIGRSVLAVLAISKADSFFFFLCSSYSPIIDFYILYARSEAPVPLLVPELHNASWRVCPERSLSPEPNLSPVVFEHILCW